MSAVAEASVAAAPTSVSDWSVAELSALYAQERSSLTGMARRILRNDAQAEEIVQEAFLKFILAAPELDSAERALAYLRTAVNNLCLNQIRATGSRPNLVAIDSETSIERINEISAEAHVPFDSTLAAAEDAAIIREALSRLSADQRTALVMWEMEGRTTEEIAEAIGTTPANVRHVVARARQSFTRTLSEWVIDEETGLTALQALSTSYKKAAELAKKSSKVALSIVVLIAAFFGFTSLKTGSVVNSVNATHEVSTSQGTPLHSTKTLHTATPKSKISVTTRKSAVDLKKLALVNGSAAKVAPLTFTGLDSAGIPTGFTVTDAQNQTGIINVTKPVESVSDKGAVSRTIAVTSDDSGAYVLLNQAITNNERGTSYSADPSVSIGGSQTPLDVAATNTYVARLSDGTYLLTATIVVNSTVNSGIISPVAHGVDIPSAPTQIVTRIHLSSDKTTILGQAIYLATTKGAN